MPFQQAPPTLGNQYEDDPVLRSYLKRVLPAEMLREIESSLIEMGRLAGGELYELQLADRLNEPKLTQWDAWGNRVDKIEVTPVWREAERVAVELGVVSTAYEQKHGSLSRIHQCALAYLFTPSTDIYSCPLAMTDGAARTLLVAGNELLIERALPHLIAREPEKFWTAGQWMTELTGGSDVGLSETVAKRESESHYRLYGRKWFTSAIASQIALTLARPDGNPPGGRGLALFYLETRDERGLLNNIEINRLKDKLGTRKVPTAELSLNGTRAELVMGTTDGVRNITPLLNHNLAGVSGNLWGLALGSVDNTIRFENDAERLATGVPEIIALPSLGDRVVLNIVDALICQYQGQEKTFLPYSAVLNQLWFSTDPVALDVLSIEELGRQRKAVNARAVKSNLELYQNASLLEIGVSDPSHIDVTRVP